MGQPPVLSVLGDLTCPSGEEIELFGMMFPDGGVFKLQDA